MKHYLIDSENVGDFWIPLLELPADRAELIVFYTKNSPHMSYDSLIKLKESDRTVTFIKCYEGTNALDFQLCSELGFLIAVNPGDEFIIVTNDTGYDAAVKYWRRKEYSVKRIAGKDSRTGSRRRGTAAKSDVASEVSSILHKLVRIPDHEESDIQEEQAEEERMESVSEDRMPLESEEDYEEGIDPEEDYDGESADLISEENAEDPEEELSEEELSEEELSEEELSEEVEEGFPEEENTAEIEEDSEEGTEEEPDKTFEDGVEDDEDSDPYAVSEPYDVPETESGDLNEEGTETNSEETEQSSEEEDTHVLVPDPDELTAIVSCIGMENLAELHNQLIQFYGDDGKDIYLSLKSGTLTIEKKEWDKEEKFLYYCALIFRHSDVPAEELSEENISEFAQFLLGAENKRKNLNSLRYALLKHYGKEKGRRYYFMLKPYVKALNQM